MSTGSLGGGGVHGLAGRGASGRCRGVSDLGTSKSNSSKLPAQASRCVRKKDKLNKFLIVAGTEVSSNWDVFVGPRSGSW